MCYHNRMVCRMCGSETWELFQGPCGIISVKCSGCDRTPLELALAGKRSERLHYFVLRAKPLELLTGNDIPPGLDPDDIAADPEKFVRT